jgi:hypothetical protein
MFLDILSLSILDPDLTFAGHAFSLNAFRDADKISPFNFQTPVTATIEYSDTDVIGVDESQLRLLYLEDDQWIDAACGPYLRNPGENWIQVPICHLSQFGLFQSHSRIFLSLITR